MNQVVQLNVCPFMIEEFVKFTEIAPLEKSTYWYQCYNV